MLRERAGAKKKNNTGRSRGGAEPSTVFDHYPNWFFLFSTRFGGKKKKYFVDIVPEMIPDFAGNETVFGFDSKDAVAGSILGQ